MGRSRSSSRKRNTLDASESRGSSSRKRNTLDASESRERPGASPHAPQRRGRGGGDYFLAHTVVCVFVPISPASRAVVCPTCYSKRRTKSQGSRYRNRCWRYARGMLAVCSRYARSMLGERSGLVCSVCSVCSVAVPVRGCNNARRPCAGMLGMLGGMLGMLGGRPAPPSGGPFWGFGGSSGPLGASRQHRFQGASAGSCPPPSCNFPLPPSPAPILSAPCPPPHACSSSPPAAEGGRAESRAGLQKPASCSSSASSSPASSM